MTKETMTIHQGLAELKILDSRIYNTVATSTFCKENIHSNQKINGVSIEEFKKYVNDKGYEYYSICAPIMEGTKELMNVTWNMLKELPPIKEYEVEEIPLESLIPEDDNSFKITQEDEGYYLVEAKWFPRVLKGIDVTDYEALQYMQRVLEKSGVFDALREKGIQEGDIVSLYDIEFEYIP